MSVRRVVTGIDADGTSHVVYRPPAAHVVSLVRDSNGRMLAGCVLGLIIGLGVIPLIALGPQQFVAANRHYLERFILPAVGGKRIDSAVERELMNPETPDRQAIVSVLTNIGHFVFHTPRSFQTRTRSYHRHQWLIMVPSQAERAGMMATSIPPATSSVPASAMIRYSARLPSWKK